MKRSRSHSITYDSLQSVIDYADNIIRDNPDMSYDSFTIDYEEEYGSYRATLEYTTEESAAEKVSRLKSEKLAEERRLEWGRKQYEALKAKFGESK